mmetsp:Transcript_50999/g.75682  ORF Transcript_50999/g.75682 Transcript_50999/m.75682 type:complete len:522 (-) Transcript_50999:199-1764(-)
MTPRKMLSATQFSVASTDTDNLLDAGGCDNTDGSRTSENSSRSSLSVESDPEIPQASYSHAPKAGFSVLRNTRLARRNKNQVDAPRRSWCRRSSSEEEKNPRGDGEAEKVTRPRFLRRVCNERENNNRNDGEVEKVVPRGTRVIETAKNMISRSGKAPTTVPDPIATLQEKTCETTFDKIVLVPDVVNVDDLRKHSWNGIPNEHRSQCWKILLGYLPANASRREATLSSKRAAYSSAVRQYYDIDNNCRTALEKEIMHQIEIDIPRTAPGQELFRSLRIRKCMERILYVWSIRHPASSYVQGISDLITPLLAVLLSDPFGGISVMEDDLNWYDFVSEERFAEVEADCYWCVTKLTEGIQDHYTDGFPGVLRLINRFESLLRVVDLELSSHFESLGVEVMHLIVPWMNCLLVREFDLAQVIRIWDTCLSEEGGFEDFIVYVCVGMMCHFTDELKKMKFEELMVFVHNIPTKDFGTEDIEMLLEKTISYRAWCPNLKKLGEKFMSNRNLCTSFRLTPKVSVGK